MALDENLRVKRDKAATGAQSVQLDVQPGSEVPVSESEEERRLVRKLDRRILPITCLMYLFACQCLARERSMSTFFTHYCNR